MKRWTRSDQRVRVTDDGTPLWIIQPDAGPPDDGERKSAIDELLEEARRAPRSPAGLARFIREARR